MNQDIINILLKEADRYETESFLFDDPSWFMHHVTGRRNKEVTAFIASCLSYGAREMFIPKIEYLLRRANGELDRWILSGEYNWDVPDNNESFYRLYTNATMNRFFAKLRKLLCEHGTLGAFAADMVQDKEAITFIEAITKYFNPEGEPASLVIPQNTQSSCKRLCMFLRWMVRDDSPVDLGIWSSFIDRKTLIMPLDTHVVQEANRLGLMNTKSTTMSAAKELTRILAKAFPDDPVRGDFALFGYGVNH